MAEQQSDTKSVTIPRKAVFKTKSTTNGVVEKRELIGYPANALSQHLTVGESDNSKKIEFLLSGDTLIDGKESYISFKFSTNKWTAFLSSDISSVIRKLEISLPSNQNQILESIDSYGTLQSMLHMINSGEDSFNSNWYSGLNSMAGFNTVNGSKSARRWLNLPDEEGGTRTCVMALNLSGIMSNTNYIPLLLLNGLKITIYLSSASDVLHFDDRNEASWDTVIEAIEMPLGKTFATMDAAERTALQDALIAFTGKAAPNAAPLTYTISSPVYNAMTVWMSSAYIDSLIKASESTTGVILHYDTHRFNQFVPQSANLNIAFTDGVQNLKSVMLACQLRDRGPAAHFNYCTNGMKGFSFRVGSRIYERVNNTCPSMALVSTLVSLGKFGKYHDSSATHTQYPRSKNVHVFNFESAKVESATAHSGINTTNGRNLRLEVEFHNTAGESVVSPTDADVTLMSFTNTVPYRDVHLNTFLEFSKYIRINSQGILVSE